ncbi:MAG TPA: ABC transporter ATP-binding protein [Alphaproteobacteria bacterium]|nr:ABC transporter ATP-binding protein [Alphaproteobacteria bacterium]
MVTLAVKNLTIDYRQRGTTLRAVDHASFSLADGEALGIVGESGCGKSTLVKGILALLPKNAVVADGAVLLQGQNMLGLDEAARRRLRWTAVAYVTQSAMDSLNPVARVIDQFAQTWRAHRRGDGHRLHATAEALFRSVGLDPRWLGSYPHELSGGMRQRVIIALSLLFEPALFVADEPTTGLDVIVQRQVLDLLRRVRTEHRMAVIFVSHDIAVVAELCSSVAVMYAGRIVEKGAAADILGRPCHPYTIGLKQAFPDIRDPHRVLISIPGAPPPLDIPLSGCAFAPRCPFVRRRCHTEAPVLRELARRQVACHFAEEADTFRERAADPSIWQQR